MLETESFYRLVHLLEVLRSGDYYTFRGRAGGGRFPALVSDRACWGDLASHLKC